MPGPGEKPKGAGAGAGAAGGDEKKPPSRTPTPPPGATLSAAELDEIRHEKARAAGIKGVVTKYAPQMEQAIKDIMRFPTEEALDDLKKCYARIEDNTDKLIEIYELLKFKDSIDNMVAWEKKIDEANRRFMDLKTKYKEAVFRIRGNDLNAGGNANAGGNPGAGGGALPRINDALKPEKLTKEWQPREYRGWKEQLKIFFEASALHRYTIKVQYGYFKSCLD